MNGLLWLKSSYKEFLIISIPLLFLTLGCIGQRTSEPTPEPTCEPTEIEYAEQVEMTETEASILFQIDRNGVFGDDKYENAYANFVKNASLGVKECFSATYVSEEKIGNTIEFKEFLDIWSENKEITEDLFEMEDFSCEEMFGPELYGKFVDLYKYDPELATYVTRNEIDISKPVYDRAIRHEFGYDMAIKLSSMEGTDNDLIELTDYLYFLEDGEREIVLSYVGNEITPLKLEILKILTSLDKRTRSMFLRMGLIGSEDEILLGKWPELDKDIIEKYLSGDDNPISIELSRIFDLIYDDPELERLLKEDMKWGNYVGLRVKGNSIISVFKGESGEWTITYTDENPYEPGFDERISRTQEFNPPEKSNCYVFNDIRACEGDPNVKSRIDYNYYWGFRETKINGKWYRVNFDGFSRHDGGTMYYIYRLGIDLDGDKGTEIQITYTPDGKVPLIVSLHATDLYMGNSGFNFYFDEKNGWKHREKSFKAFHDDLRNEEYGIPGITEDKAREYYDLLLELGHSVINIRYFTIHLGAKHLEAKKC